MNETRSRLPSLKGSLPTGVRSTIVTTSLAVALALAVGGLFILISNQNPIDAYGALLDGAFGGRRPIAETLVATTPMILGGLAFAIAARASMFNIGIEGQLIIGSLCGALMGAGDLGLPKLLYIPLGIIVGGITGGLWAAIPGVLKVRTGASEVITTIMLNYLAFRTSTYAVTGAASWLPWVNPEQNSTNP